MRLSQKHICNFRDCPRFAMWQRAMCPGHGSAGGRALEGRPLSEKSKAAARNVADELANTHNRGSAPWWPPTEEQN